MPGVLRVRLIAPLAIRRRAVIERGGRAPPDAERVIRQRDATPSPLDQAMYGVDLADPKLYDLVVNLEAMSLAIGLHRGDRCGPAARVYRHRCGSGEAPGLCPRRVG